MKINCLLDATRTMYPCKSEIISLIENEKMYDIAAGASVYGWVVSGKISFKDTTVADDNSFASISAGVAFCVNQDMSIAAERESVVWLITRFGFRAPSVISKPEHHGRLSHIDGCSDSLVIYPPRKGDGGMSLLYFPPGITQSWHAHPSIRIGYVIGGDGVAEWYDTAGRLQTHELKEGDCFMLPEHEQHRFSTSSGSELRVLAYHPDGEWGPEDRNRTMLNRTYAGVVQQSGQTT